MSDRSVRPLSWIHPIHTSDYFYIRRFAAQMKDMPVCVFKKKKIHKDFGTVNPHVAMMKSYGTFWNNDFLALHMVMDEDIFTAKS